MFRKQNQPWNGKKQNEEFINTMSQGGGKDCTKELSLSCSWFLSAVNAEIETGAYSQHMTRSWALKYAFLGNNHKN